MVQKLTVNKFDFISGLLIITLLVLFTSPVFGRIPGETKTPGKRPAVGVIKGRVLDGETQKPLADVIIVIVGTQWQTGSDSNGTFIFQEIPLGSYSLMCNPEGYYAETRTDVMVRPNRTTFVKMELFKARVIREEVSVSAGYFPENPAETVSTLEFNSEELRRDAGSIGSDVSRALYNVPGIIKADEIANDLLVRGGSPMENGFYVDNIPFINVNHYPQQGASGGNVSYLNLDFIEKVQISTGGFDASYGNRLSSIIDINYREGNRERVEGQLNLSLIAYGGQIEGPLPNHKGSWMVSGNRSYLALIEDAVSGGSDETPSFYDFQSKLTYDINANHHLSLLVVGGHSQTLYQGQTTGYEKYDQLTAGINWRWLWGDKGYSDTSVSFAKLKAREDNPESGGNLYNYTYLTTGVTIRNVNRLQLSSNHQFQFGLEANHLFHRYTPRREGREDSFDGTFAGAYLTYTTYPFSSLSLTSGLRLDYFPFSERFHLSPRFSFSWLLSNRLSLNGAFGMYYQQMSLFLLKQDPGNIGLQDPQARHLVLGVKYLLSKDVRVILDLYDKQYRHLPMAYYYPYSYPLDDVSGDDANAYFLGPLVDKGKSYARGIEISLQKKLRDKLYGLVSFTYFRTRYRDLMGVWRNRLFDYRFGICLSGGYKPNKKWEFSGRFIWSGNRAYSPVEEAMSRQVGYPWIPVENILADYLPDYQTLSLRVDRRFFFARSNLVIFAGALNVMNRENEVAKYWNPQANEYFTEHMWGIVPYIGIEFEF
jgi:hypothetical protein